MVCEYFTLQPAPRVPKRAAGRYFDEPVPDEAKRQRLEDAAEEAKEETDVDDHGHGSGTSVDGHAESSDGGNQEEWSFPDIIPL